MAITVAHLDIPDTDLEKMCVVPGVVRNVHRTNVCDRILYLQGHAHRTYVRDVIMHRTLRTLLWDSVSLTLPSYVSALDTERTGNGLH